MFTIIGGDGKEYGPVTADQIRAWLAAGRASLETQAKLVGADEWRRVGDFPEFSATAGAPPPLVLATGSDPNLADRAVRLGSAAIDWALSAIAAAPGLVILGSSFLTLIVAASQGREPRFEDLNVGRVILGGVIFAIGSLTLLVIQVWLISTRGQSIGKRLCKIRIVRFADGSPPGFVYGWLLRNFVTGIISAIPYLGGLFALVDICFIFGEQRRCLHDLIAGTKVVKA